MYKGKIILDFDKIYSSNSYGTFKIIEDIGKDQRSRQLVKIKFLDTGTEKVVRYDLAMAGRVSDELYGIDFNKIYESWYYGKYQIVSYVGMADSRKIVRIRFLNTGYEYDVQLKQVKNNEVRDATIEYHDKVLPSYERYNEFIIFLLTRKWKSMMQRCYNSRSLSYVGYGSIGVTVCEEWKNLDNFLSSIQTVPNFNKFYCNPANYQLDKDLFQQNIPRKERIYSPNTCIFLSIVDNANLAIMLNSNDKIYGIKSLGNGKYRVEFSIRGEKHRFGTYSNIIAAANAYNHFYVNYAEYEYIPLINTTFPYMSYEETQKYLVSKKEDIE